MCPLTAGCNHHLNHFAVLFEEKQSPVVNLPVPATDKGSQQPGGAIAKKTDTALNNVVHEASVSSSEAKGCVPIPPKPKRKAKNPKTPAAEATHQKNMNVVNIWSRIIGIDKEAAARHDDARIEELKRVSERSERRLACEESVIVESLLDSIIDKVESLLSVQPTKVPVVTLPCGRPKEMTWHARALMVAFLLHPDLGAGNVDIFHTVFGHLVQKETLRNWLRKEKVHKWIEIVASATKADILQIIPEKDGSSLTKAPRIAKSRRQYYPDFVANLLLQHVKVRN
jgi:Asp-tRNA(Asn)/Glu-tRNA(Gln) amidotransferase C subunit